MVIVKKSSPVPTIDQHLTSKPSMGYRQVIGRLPTDKYDC